MKGKLVGATLAVGAAWLALGRLRRNEPLRGVYSDTPTRVVIVGGGFGGLAAVEKLARGVHDARLYPHQWITLRKVPRLAL